MRQAVISLLPKKDNNPLDCSSYRPVLLLNTDVKILTKILARRLEKITPSIIAFDQTVFIKKCYSFFSIRWLFNILYGPTPPDPENIEVILSLDADKTFDRVERDYLFKTLEIFGFGPKFISWIKILYTFPVAAVHTNNNLSTYFELKWGTRQGCPLSPLLFTVALEPLALPLRAFIRQVRSIKCHFMPMICSCL